MHPPFSIIFMTTLFGLGQGLFLALFTGQVYSLFKLLPPADGPQFYGIGSSVALLLLFAGLIASFFHLGHPERAWRAATQWRTSWLSREVILLPILIFVLMVYGGLHILGWTPPIINIAGDLMIDLTVLFGAVGTLVCFALYLATGMIYAGVRFIQEWASPLTVINFVLLGGASGFTLATAFSMVSAPHLVGFFGGWAIIITLLALGSRSAALIRNRRLKRPSSLRTAIGIRHDNIRQLHQGAMGGSFNTQEFFHGKGDLRLRRVKWGFLVLTFPLPILLIALGLVSSVTIWLVAAVILQYIGLLLERWFFFAEGKHPQNLYYQSA
jgi:DMSO reductase anchor subunit